MAKKYVMFSMDDENIRNLSTVLGNKKCKKILDFLSETKEASEKDIADSLKIPLNTVEYNLKKLLKSNLIEKTKNFFWSKKGKKIPMYKVSNKSIIISPKLRIINSITNLLPVALLSGIGGLMVRKFYLASQEATKQLIGTSTEALPAISVASNDAQEFTKIIIPEVMNQSSIWIWVLGGILVGLIILFIVKKIIKMKGGRK
ncbi:MAG: helix-turn-helix domain-containing protein [Nanoarchaeota archaeon]|nr:helix-turn-helix domain-containing protein [Nanoarchaeota archaeon]MBU1027763.1 helix-turn-helix domain-containing protein [Nanoarchaeota archaeon]